MENDNSFSINLNSYKNQWTLKEYEEEIERLRMENFKLKHKITILKNRDEEKKIIEGAKLEIEKLQSENFSLKNSESDRNVCLIEENRRLLNYIENLNIKNEELHNLSNQSMQLHNENQEMKIATAKITENITHKNQEIEKYKEIMRIIITSMQNYEEELSAVENSVEKLIMQLNFTEKSKKFFYAHNIKLNVNCIINGLFRELHNREKNLRIIKKENKDLTKFSVINSEYKKFIEDFTEEFKNAQRELIDCQKFIENKNREIKKLKKEINALKNSEEKFFDRKKLLNTV